MPDPTLAEQRKHDMTLHEAAAHIAGKMHVEDADTRGAWRIVLHALHLYEALSACVTAADAYIRAEEDIPDEGYDGVSCGADHEVTCPVCSALNVYCATRAAVSEKATDGPDEEQHNADA